MDNRKSDILAVLDDAILNINKHMRETKPRSTPSEIIFNVLNKGLAISCIVCLDKKCTCKPRVR